MVIAEQQVNIFAYAIHSKDGQQFLIGRNFHPGWYRPKHMIFKVAFKISYSFW